MNQHTVWLDRQVRADALGHEVLVAVDEAVDEDAGGEHLVLLVGDGHANAVEADGVEYAESPAGVDEVVRVVEVHKALAEAGRLQELRLHGRLELVRCCSDALLHRNRQFLLLRDPPDKFVRLRALVLEVLRRVEKHRRTLRGAHLEDLLRHVSDKLQELAVGLRDDADAVALGDHRDGLIVRVANPRVVGTDDEEEALIVLDTPGADHSVAAAPHQLEGRVLALGVEGVVLALERGRCHPNGAVLGKAGKHIAARRERHLAEWAVREVLVLRTVPRDDYDGAACCRRQHLHSLVRREPRLDHHPRARRRVELGFLEGKGHGVVKVLHSDELEVGGHGDEARSPDVALCYLASVSDA
mmetsp:Transcript_18176/g.70271  ORF Transcript_18176/g.70271 Transcript_18176/m.70271 type:complete len:357 (-) Transcript_18176:355-1425(-)